jgi:hypothetical protein
LSGPRSAARPPSKVSSHDQGRQVLIFLM